MDLGANRRTIRQSFAPWMGAATVTLFLAVGLLAAGCGDGLGTDEPPSVTVEGESSPARSLPTPPRTGRQGDPLKINIKSNGDSDLTIQGLSLSDDISDRIAHEGEDTGKDCVYSASDPKTNSKATEDPEVPKCAANEVCDETTNTCLSRDFEETPITVPPPQEKQFRFFLTASESGAVACPEAGSDVPQEFREKYCGSFTIETDAPTSDSEGLIEDGNITFYFQVDAGSGEIAVEPKSIAFDNVEPGATEEKDLNVINNGQTPLQITSMQVDKHRDILNVLPQNTPTSIDGGGQQSWTVELNIPSSMAKEDIPSSSAIFIESSATNTSTATAVNISIGTGSTEGPAIGFDKKAVSFKDGSTQTVEISNSGQEALRLTSLEVDAPTNSSVDDDTYQFKYKGNPVNDGNITDSNGIEPGGSAQLEITLDGADNLKPAWLKLNHNDPVANGQFPSDDNNTGTSRLLLLAGQDAAYGQVVPTNLNFELADEEASMNFVIRSLGNQPLEVKEDWASDSEPPNFPIQGLDTSSTTSIDAGDQKVFTQKFLGKTGEMPEQLTALFPGNTAGPAMELAINAFPNSGNADPQAEITRQFEGNTLEVGQVGVFNANNSSFSADMPFYRWIVLDRPDDSDVFAEHGGQSERYKRFTLRPDQPGTYKIGLILSDGNFDDMATMDIEAEPAESEN